MYQVKHLMISLERCDFAQKLFQENKKIHQGLRLKAAYKKLIEIIEYNLHHSEDVNREALITLLFYVEDWIHNFENELKKAGDNLDLAIELPVFENTISYPTEYLESLKSDFDAPGWHHDTPSW